MRVLLYHKRLVVPSAPPVMVLGYAEPVPDETRRGAGGRKLLAHLFVLAFGLLLVYGVLAATADRLTGGHTMMQPWGMTLIGAVGLFFAWAGGLGIRYWYLRRALRQLPPTSSRLTLVVRRLFHATRVG